MGAPDVVTYAALPELVGRVLTGVNFVADYLELHLDGPILRSLAAPTISVGGADHEFPNPGSRDALCSLLDETVVAASEDETSVTVCFTGGSFVSIPRFAIGAGAEVAHLVPYINGALEPATMRTWENLRSDTGSD